MTGITIKASVLATDVAVDTAGGAFAADYDPNGVLKLPVG